MGLLFDAGRQTLHNDYINKFSSNCGKNMNEKCNDNVEGASIDWKIREGHHVKVTYRDLKDHSKVSQIMLHGRWEDCPEME